MRIMEYLTSCSNKSNEIDEVRANAHAQERENGGETVSSPRWLGRSQSEAKQQEHGKGMHKTCEEQRALTEREKTVRIGSKDGRIAMI